MWRAKGKVSVPVPGTPVRATANESDPTLHLACHSLLFQALSGNAGKVYILDRQTGNKATGVGVLAVLPVPTANSIPGASATITSAPGALNLADYWIDSDNADEGVIVSVLIL